MLQVRVRSGSRTLSLTVSGSFELFYQRVKTLPEYTTILNSGCVEYSVSPIRGTNLLLLIAPVTSDTCVCKEDPITLLPPKPKSVGPCTINDSNYISRYKCSDEMRYEHERRPDTSSAAVWQHRPDRDLRAQNQGQECTFSF
eukprot:sb/3474169/